MTMTIDSNAPTLQEDAKPTVNQERITNDMLALARIGFNEEDRGVYRPAFSDADMEARRWLMAAMRTIGVEARMDGAGNVIGRIGPADQPAVMVGSHTDSQLCGGIFDGTLGVIAGLECLRVIREHNIPIALPIELVSFADEEGRFGGMFGSQAMSGQITLDWIENAQDPDGVTLRDAMKGQGLDPADAMSAYREPATLSSFLELHIEQGPVLEQAGKSIGVVRAITGVFVWVIHLKGKADHSGTAPMNMRSDAFMGLADFAHEIPRIIDEEGTEMSRLTVGWADLKPGAPHTVPGEAVFTLVGRDQTVDAMESLANTCRRVLSAIARRHRLMFEYEEMSWLEPEACHPEIIGLCKRNAEELGLEYEEMVSGAGHDVQFMAKITRAGLLFVPSQGGVSHAPDEWTHWTDVEKGANVLLRTLLHLAGTSSSTKANRGKKRARVRPA
jgi:N-carbamoyl-L-amino-acid hydrolase